MKICHLLNLFVLAFAGALSVAASRATAAENLLRNGSFEGSTKYWAEDGDLVQDSPAHGAFCVRLREKGDLRSGSIRIQPDSTVTVSLWARAEKEGSVQVTLCPSNREVAQQTKTVWCKDPRFGGSAKVGTEWSRHTWTFKIPKLEGNGGFLGATSGWWNKTSYVLFVGGNPRPLWIDGISVELSEKTEAYAAYSPIEVTATAPAVSRERFKTDANLLQPDEEVEIRSCAFNPGAVARTVTLRWELLDYEGARRFGEAVDRKVSIEPGKTAVETAKLKLTGRGLMLGRVSALDEKGTLLGQSDQPLTVLAFRKNATKPDPEERIGSSIRGGPLTNASQQIGLGWTRWYPQLNWEAIQPDGPDHWQWPDETMQELRSHGLCATAVIHSLPKWAKGQHPHLPKDLASWAKDDNRWDDLTIETMWDRFVKELVKHYGHEAIVYEFANEPDISKWDGADYYNLALRTYRVVKQTDPKALVQVNVTWPGVSGWTMDFLKRGGLKAFDIHTFHNYTTGPLANGNAIIDTKNVFKSFGATDKDIWFNEGWTYIPTSEDYAAPPIVDLAPADVAHMIVRTVADLFAADMKKLITFHNGYAQNGRSWWDWVGSGTEWWDDHGNPTVAVPVYNVLCDHLGLSRHEKTVRTENALFHIFQDLRNGRGVIVAWATNGEAVLDLPLTGLLRHNVMGVEDALPVQDGKTRIVLPKGLKPSYFITQEGLSAAEMAKRLLPLDVETARANEKGVWRAPLEWQGKELDKTEGNPFVTDGKPLWRLERVWPDDPMKAAHYVLMPWSGREWKDPQNNHGGQPGASVNREGIHLGSRGGWGGTPAQKLATLTFVAPLGGRFTVEGMLNADIWEGRGPVDVHLLKRSPGADAAAPVQSWALEKNKPVKLENLKVELAEGEMLTIVPHFRGMHTAATIQIRELALRLVPVEKKE
ncbi:MAG: hypothetical protein NTW87_07225 [Planctomycetota bacterium]|nr:hypothetical protein [Planctomycetota bacterium]